MVTLAFLHLKCSKALMNLMSKTHQITINTLQKKKQLGEKISCLTCYDASFSEMLESAGVEVLLVGDSLGMVIQGQSTTIPVTMDDMVYHCKIVTQGCHLPIILADMPFMSYATTDQALINAGRLMQEGHAHMVKLEGGEEHEQTIKHLVAAGIPVCGHLGLLPQSIYQMGHYRVHGKTSPEAEKIFQEALMLEEAGISMLILECVPVELARKITQKLSIPVIGIGAGSECDGQVLVLYDMLGINTGHCPKFTRNFLPGKEDIRSAIVDYVNAVKSGEFPNHDESYH